MRTNMRRNEKIREGSREGGILQGKQRLLIFCLVGILMLCGCATHGTEMSPATSQTTATPTQTDSATPIPTEMYTEAPTPMVTLNTTEIPTTTQSLTSTKTPGPAVTLKPTQAPTKTPTQAPTQTPTKAPTQKPTQTPKPTVQRPEGSLKGLVIGIDPGHQGKGNAEQEPVGPGATETKKKVSSGTQGKWSRVPEYEVVLNVGLRLKELLESAGATVIMSRETNNVNISNAERAIMMNEANCDLVLRIHCDGNDNASIQGASMLVPVGDYTTAQVQAISAKAGEEILERFVAVTGAKSRGLRLRADLSGFNWSTVPVCLIEMGFMSNQEEDLLLTSEDYQEKCAEGLYQGILLYFN